MNTDQRTITAVTPDSLSEFIAGAQERLVVLAPALDKKVALALAEKWRQLGAQKASVILDLDPEVFRLGYGEIESLKVLEETANALGTMIQRQKGIRIGLIIADERTLVFSPTPALVEAGPASAETPNAILLEATPPTVAKELGQGEHGVKDQKVGLDKATKADVQSVQENIKLNPPQRFDIARTVRVFNAHFEFVEFEMTGTHIGRKTIPIPAELMGLARDDQTKRRMRATFRIVDERDSLSGHRLQQAKAWLAKTYLTSLPGYGNVVLRVVKPDFEKKVEQLERCIELFKKAVEKRLQDAIDANRKTLTDALLPSVLNSPPQRWRKYYGSNPTEEIIRTLLEDEIAKASGTAERLVGDMKLKVIFKGVTYELLGDEKFMEVARKALPSLPEFHTEYDAAKGDNPEE